MIQSAAKGTRHIQDVRAGLRNLPVRVREDTKDAVSYDDVGGAEDLYFDWHGWRGRNARGLQLQVKPLAQADDTKVSADGRYGDVCVGRGRHGGQSAQDTAFK